MNKHLTKIVLTLVALIAMPCLAQSYPATDSFSGSGALSSNWTNTTVGTGLSYPPVTLAQASGKVVPSTSGGWGFEFYTGVTFTNDQYAQAVFVAHSTAAGGTGPCVRMSAGGNAYCYAADNGVIMTWNNGVWSTTVVATCPIPATGDTIQISAVGTTITCKDVTTGVSASGTDTTYWLASGNPGIVVDQRNSTVYALSSFQTDCIPTCSLGTVATPTFSPVAGTYSSTQTVTISDATSGSTIHYTTDGSTPTASSATYSSAISVAVSETVKAIAVKTGYTNSAVGSAAYTLTAATPTFSPAAGTYSSTQTVTISDTSSGATIHYTTDGSTPTASSATYSSAITVAVSETVKALAVKTGYTNSAVGSAAYTLTVTTPTFSPGAGTYESAQTVTINDATSGATIHYTTDGSTPTASSVTYTAPITVAGTETVKAIGVLTGWTNGGVGSAAYIISPTYPATDSFSGSGALSANWTQTAIASGVTLTYPPVTLVQASGKVVPNTSSSWGLAEYTGLTFTADQYAQAVFVSHIATGVWTGPCVRMTSVGNGYCYMAEQGAIVLMNNNQWYQSIASTCPVPSSGDTVKISAIGTTITCTDVTTGVSSSGTDSTYWVGQIPGVVVDTRSSSPLEALSSFQADCVPTCGTASTVATPTFSPAAGTYSSTQTVTISDATSGATLYYTTNGTTPTTSSTVYSTAISVSATETVKAIGVKAGYANSSVGSAAYTITATVATPTFSPAAGIYTSTQTVTISSSTSGATIYYTTNGTTPTTSSTLYSTAVTVSASETIKALAVKSGYTNSSVGSAAYTINLTVATPTFSPVAGTYTSAQSVAISDATSGTTIYYTTNGTTPTTSSTLYSTAITVSTSETVKALGVKSGYTNSSVGSAAYTITIGGTYPVTDAFAGSGALSANWTNTIAGASLSFPPVPLVRSSGTVVPNASGWGLAVYTGSSFTNDQYAQVVFQAHTTAGGWTGPCARVAVGGNSYCYMADYGAIVLLNNGIWDVTLTSACPIPASGDTVQISAVGTTITCKDVTTGVSAFVTDSTYWLGQYPGVIVDTRASSNHALASFQADCVPTCVITPTPTFSPSGGSYSTPQTVTISDSATGATIYYTIDGTTPTTSSSTYSSPITVSYSDTVMAIATAPGDVSSAVGSATYILPVSTPTFSPGAGSYNSLQPVTISDLTPGATIYYTTNGTTPTTSSSVYSSPISVGSTETVKAIAVLSGSPNSTVASAAYVIQVAKPVFSPVAGAYLSTQTVTITDSSSGATIHYTTDGSIPTSGSTTYTGAISVSTSKTLKAIGILSGFDNSQIASAQYTIGKTLSSVAISPVGAAIQSGSSQQFTVTCTYSDLSTDACAQAGGATWDTTALNQTRLSVTSAGLATWHTDPGAGNADARYVIVTAGGLMDKGIVFAQHPGDTWYQYPTPTGLRGDSVSDAPLPVNVAVGSTVTIGSGVSINDPHMGATPRPFEDTCSFASSNTSIATVNRRGQVTAVAPGTVTITCGRTGDAVYGTSTMPGWTSTVDGTQLTFNIVAGGTSNTTWYVLPGGGTLYSTTNTAGQCSGKVNQTYAAAGGTGVNQACGVGNIRNLWADGVSYEQMLWVISGGDTVIVAQNSAGYNTGLDAPPSPWLPINCNGNQSGCFMPTIPSGTASRHTKILGANYASCHADSSKTLLNLTYSAGMAINVTDSQFVDVACFEIRTKAGCGFSGYSDPSPQFPCAAGANNGSDGIGESAWTGSVNYTDLFIHGMAHDGIYGATGVGVVADYVHIRASQNGGIDMDDHPWNGNNISVAGGLTLTNSITEWTGCVEEYPIVHTYPVLECRGQGAGAYGDGFGTASTTGNWIFDHDTWKYNFQDGLDLAHSGMQELSVTNSVSIANDGQAYKIGSGDNVIFRNNIAMVNCLRLGETIGDEPATATATAQSPGTTLCRAAGNWVPMNFTDQGTYLVQNNTLIGYGATPFDVECEGGWDYCQNAGTVYQNNIVMGYSDPNYNDGQEPGLFYLEQDPSLMPPNGGWAIRDHNLYFQYRGTCPLPLFTGEICTDPMFVGGEPASPISAESDLDGFSFTPASGSPLIGAGVFIPGLTKDANGITRPNPPSIGAIE